MVPMTSSCTLVTKLILCSSVVHVCHSLEAAISEIPPLLRGEPIRPGSKLGSNMDSGKIAVPKAIVVGKGFSDEEMETLRDKVPAGSVPWLLPDDGKMTWTRIGKAAGTGGIALPGIIADRVVECLEEHGLVPGSDVKTDGGVWGF